MTEEQAVQEEEFQDNQDMEYFSDNEEIKKDPVGRWVNKADLLDNPKKIQPLKLGIRDKDKKRYFVEAKLKENIEGERPLNKGEIVLVNANSTNKNEVLEIMGSKVSEWPEKDVMVVSSAWEGDIEGQQRTGYSLKFYV